MLTWWIGAALAAGLTVDAHVAVHVAVDGEAVGEIYVPGTLYLPVPAGEHVLVITRGGVPSRYDVQVPDDGTLHVLVGKTGTTLDTVAPQALVVDPDAPTRLVLRTADASPILVHVQGRRHLIAPEADTVVELPAGPGEYPMVVRSGDGTNIFARGVLRVAGGEVVVQVAEGALPETGGEGGSFVPAGR